MAKKQKKVDAQQKANDLASQLAAVYQAQNQASMNQALQQGGAMAGLAQAIDPSAVYKAGGNAPLTSWGGTSVPNQQGGWYGGGGAGQSWSTPYQNGASVSGPQVFNPIEFLTEEQQDQLASLLLKKVLKAISTDDKEMLRKLLRGKI